MKNKFLIFNIILILFSANTFAQSGGTFEITQSVVAGGGQNSAGGAFSVDGTTGQAIAGNALGGQPFTVTSGFWNFTPLAPTAASVTVSGKIVNSARIGIPRAVVVISGSNGTIRTTLTNSFGYYRFEGVEVGETYIFDVRSKSYNFAPQVIYVSDNLERLDFIAL